MRIHFKRNRRHDQPFPIRSALACAGPDPVACEGRVWDPNCHGHELRATNWDTWTWLFGGSRVKVMVVSGKCFFLGGGSWLCFCVFVFFFFLCFRVFFFGFRGGGRGEKTSGCFGVFCLGLIVVYDFLGWLRIWVHTPLQPNKKQMMYESKNRKTSGVLGLEVDNLKSHFAD